MKSNNKTTADAATQDWQGYTLEQLRFRRAMAAIKSQMGRERIAAQFAQSKQQLNDNGLRSAIFSKSALSGLKTVDYVLLGYKVSKLGYKVWKKFKGRRS